MNGLNSVLTKIVIIVLMGTLVACGINSNKMEQQAQPYPTTSKSKNRAIFNLETPVFNTLKVVNNAAYDAMYFKHYGVNPTIDTEESAISTFSVDVDTASYHLAKAYLRDNNLPDEAAIRVEEFINTFDYHYPEPENALFNIQAEVFPSPNRTGYHLLHIGINGKHIPQHERKPANLVFVIDVSGSMAQNNVQTLGLLITKTSFETK